MGLNLVLQIKKSWHYRRICDKNVLIIEDCRGALGKLTYF